MNFIQKILRKLKFTNITQSILDEPSEAMIIDDSDDAELLHVYSEIEKAKSLAQIINGTIIREQFNSSVKELKEILNGLIMYEDKYDIDPAPSKDLEYIENNEKHLLELMEKRLALEIQSEKINIDSTLSQSETAFETIKNIVTYTQYKSKRMVIKGVHLYFIDIAREIVEQKTINAIPLMREYHISEYELNEIISEIQEAGIIDAEKNVLMEPEELEKFLDIYEPSIFKCANSAFDKEIFLCIGEIIYDKGVEDTYSSLPADEVIDYLNIMENLKILSYDNNRNIYDVLATKEEFDKISECIPSSFSNETYQDSQVDYSNANYDNMTGIEFEKFCAYLLSQSGYENIKITPVSGDHGIDILATKNEITYAIQCKCYSDNVGNAAVQQAHTGKSLYHKDIAVVMINRYFTSQAMEEANALGVKLWDRDKLNEMIANT